MLDFCSLYSGSTGNCLFIHSNKTKILIDAGASAKSIVLALASIDIDINDINAILVTHEHIDHVKSIGTLSKKYNIPVYANSETWDHMPEQKNKISPNNIFIFQNNKEFQINDLTIFPFSTPHDAANSCGFNIFNKNKKISIATDLGHITEEIMNRLKGSTFLMLESNYEPNILNCCKYPYYLKNRISSPTGHLSNEIASKITTKLINSGLKSVTLGHLSKENNFPDLAYKTLLNELKNNNYPSDIIDITIATRSEPTKVIHIL